MILLELRPRCDTMSVALLALVSVHGYSLAIETRVLGRTVRAGSPLAAAKEDVFASAGWATLQPALDRLPCFTVANEEGQPLQYEMNGKPLAVFYVDIAAAQVELKAARESSPTLESTADLIPVGLGQAYKLSCEGQAVLVPGTADLQAAGAPADVEPMGQAVPLFACMDMSREGPSGAPELPLFLCHAECEAAVAQASAADEPDAPLEIVGLSLPTVIERLTASSGEPLAFAFVPPAKSTTYIETYLSATAGPPSPPPAP